MARVVTPWGHEEWLAVFPDRYVVKQLHVTGGEGLSLQRHLLKHETQFCVSGHARIQHGRELQALDEIDIVGHGRVAPEASITFEPGVWHRITAVTDVILLQVQTAYPGWSHDIERREDVRGRAGTLTLTTDRALSP